MKSKIVALLVMAQDGHGQLIEQLEASGIDFLLANDCGEAREIFEMQHSVQLVITDVALPDGDWGSVLELVQQIPLKAEVLVCVRDLSAGLWCEILQRGAYDLLVEPYRREEVLRILNGAVAHSHTCSQLAS